MRLGRGRPKGQLARPEMHFLVQGMAQKDAKICLPSLCFSSSGYMIASPRAMPRQLVCLGILLLLDGVHPSHRAGDSPALPQGAQQVKGLVETWNQPQARYGLVWDRGKQHVWAQG